LIDNPPSSFVHLQVQVLKASLDQALGMGPPGQAGPSMPAHQRWQQLEQALGIGEHGASLPSHLDLAPLPSVPVMLSSLIDAARLLGASGGVVDSLLANTAQTAYSYVSAAEAVCLLYVFIVGRHECVCSAL
jgi:hypothetical protein